MEQKLRGKIIEKGYTLKTFSQKIGMPYGTLSRKLNNSQFTWRDVQVIANALGINNDSEELKRIFFS